MGIDQAALLGVVVFTFLGIVKAVELIEQGWKWLRTKPRFTKDQIVLYKYVGELELEIDTIADLKLFTTTDLGKPWLCKLEDMSWKIDSQFNVTLNTVWKSYEPPKILVEGANDNPNKT